MRAVALAVLGLVLAAPAAGRENLPRLRPYTLVGLPSLGSVTWRCGRTDGVYGLGYRGSGSTATTTVSVRAGKQVTRKRFDPPQSARFPLSRAAVQRVTLVQMTEPGTLRAVVTVRFAEKSRSFPPCQPYLPPRFEVALYPRPNGR